MEEISAMDERKKKVVIGEGHCYHCLEPDMDVATMSVLCPLMMKKIK
jgi:hypothetical protein